MTWRNWISNKSKRKSRPAVPKAFAGVRIAVQQLEDRALPRPSLYVEFGDRFAGGKLTDTVGNFVTLVNGPGLGNNADTMLLTSFNANFGTGAATTTSRATIMSLVRRYFEPTDVEVVELTATPTTLSTGQKVQAAATLTESAQLLAANNSTANHNDTIVFVTRVAINGVDQGNGGLLGISNGSDIGDFNLTEGSALSILADPVNNPTANNDAVDVAITVTHEAGHSFGLRHAYDTSFSGFLGKGATMYHGSEVMSYLTPFNSQGQPFGTSGFFSRVPTTAGDGNKSLNTLQGANGTDGPFNQYAADPDVGQNTQLEYVTGTGAHDVISVKRADATTATVTVEPFLDAGHSAPIDIPGSPGNTVYTYTIDLTKTILIDAGIGDDEITIDPSLGVSYRVRGMGGTDSLIISGSGAESVVYVPGANTKAYFDGQEDVQGSFNLNGGKNTISFSEFDTDSVVTVENVAVAGLASPAAGDDIMTLGMDKAGVPVITATFAGGFTPIISLTLGTGVKSIALDVGTGDTAKNVNTMSFDFSNGNPLTKFGAVFIGGAGIDTVPITRDADFAFTAKGLTIGGSANALQVSNVENFNLTGGAGANKFDLSGWAAAVNIDGAGGTDTVLSVKDTNYIVLNAQIKASDGLVATTKSTELLSLTGGAGANTFDLNAYTGTGSFDGGAGSDTVSLTRDTNFTVTNSTIATDDGSNLTVVNFEAVNLIGGPSANTFNLMAFTGAAKLDGLAGADTYIVNPGQQPVTVADSGADGATDKLIVAGTPGNDIFTFPAGGGVKVNGLGSFITTGIEQTSVDGGDGDDTFVLDLTPGFGKFTLPTVTGGAGRDSLAFIGTPAGVGKIAQGSVVVTGPSSGRYVLDPDASGGAVQASDPGPDAFVFDFAGDFEGVLSAVPVDRFDVPLTDGDDTATLATGTPVNGIQNLQLIVNGFSVAAGNVGRFVVDGLGGADNLTVDLSGSITSIGSIDVYGDRSPDTAGADDGAGDTFTVAQSKVPVNLFGQDGNDTFALGSDANGTDLISTIANIDGGAGSNALVLNDRGAASANSKVTIAPTGVTGLLGPTAGITVSTAGVADLTVIGSNVDQPESFVSDGITIPLTIDAAGGSDTVTVTNYSGSVLGVVGGSGDDTVTVTGANATSAIVVNLDDGNDSATVAGSSAPDGLFFRGGAGNDQFTVAGYTGKDVVITGGDGDETATVDAPNANITYRGGDGFETFDSTGGSISGLNMIGGTGGLKVTVGAGPVPLGFAVTNDGGGAVAISATGVTAPFFNLQPTADSLTINVSQITVPDFFVEATGGPATINVSKLAGTARITLGDAGNTLTVDSVSGPVILSAGTGADTVNITGADSVSLLLGDGANVANVSSSSTVVIRTGAGDDSATLTNISTSTDVQTSAGNDTIALVGPVGTEFVAGGDGNDTITVAIATPGATIDGGAGDDTITIGSSTAGANSTVTGGDGNDTINVGQSTLAGIAGPVSVDGGNGTDTLALNDTANTADTTYTISRDIVGRNALPGVSVASLESFGLLGGSGKNTYQVNSTQAGGLTVTDGAGASKFIVAGDQLAGAVVLNGGGGDDTYTLAAGAGISTPTLTLDGGAGTDSLAVTAKAGDDNLTYTFGGTAPSLTGLGTALPLGGIEALTLDGGTGNNAVTVADASNKTYGSVLSPQSGAVVRPTAVGAGELTVAGGTAARLTYTNFRNGVTYNGDVDGSGDRDVISVLAFSATGSGRTGALADTTVANGADRITVTDALVDIDNGTLGKIGRINFATVKNNSTVSAVLVFAGNEAGTTGDTVMVTASSKVNILVDAGGPTVRPGDQLILNTVGSTTVDFLGGSDPTLGPPQTRITDDSGASIGAIGFEQQPQVLTYAVATGAGVASQVQVYDAITGRLRRTFTPYDGSFLGGVSVASADVTGDGVTDTIVGAGPGGGPQVVVYDGVTGNAVTSFFAYEATFTGGVQVSAGDVDADGFADLILGTGIGGGPRVQVLSGKSGATLMNFFAYESTFRNGVQVSAGDVNGDGKVDVVTGSGVGGGPRARAFSGFDGSVLADFFAYDGGLRFGVNVAAGDLDGDGLAEIITGPGTTAVPNVRVFKGNGVAVADFYVDDTVGQPAVVNSVPLRPGVRVGTADITNDGIDEILVGMAAGTQPLLRGYSLTAGGVQIVRELNTFDGGYNAGIFVG